MATLTFNGRLPGVVCQTALPPAGEAPLRLDVAGFVGFAERGPLNTPVALEDFSQYQALFGGDLAVARDGGRPVYAHLPGAVQAFFDNGGRRCYVVRVAGPGARPNQFPLPGLVSWRATEGYRCVVAPAAWAGAWSDTMTLGTQLRVRPLPIYPAAPPVAPPPGLTVVLEVPVSLALGAGDLLALSFAGDEQPWLLYPVSQVQRLGTAPASTRGAPVAALADLEQVRAFTRRRHEPLPLPVAVERLDASGWNFVVPGGMADLAEAPGGLELYLPNATPVRPGDLLRVTGEGGEVLFFPVSALGLRRETLSPPALPDLRLITSAPLWEAPAPVGALPGGLRQVDLLTFDLTISEGDEAQERYQELRFGGGPGYWIDRLASLGDGGPAALPDISGERSLRLRAPADAGLPAGSGGSPLYLPLGMPLLPEPDLLAGPLAEASVGGGLPGKDGLDEFDPAGLFLDERLRGFDSGDLILEAERLLYYSQPPVQLDRLHALIAVEEVGLLAIPDLAHRAWGPPLPLPPSIGPIPPAIEPPDWSRFRDCPVPPLPVTLAPEDVVAGFLGALQGGDEDAARDYLTPELLARLDAGESLLLLLGLEELPLLFRVEPPPCRPLESFETEVRATITLSSGAELVDLFRLTGEEVGEGAVRWSIADASPQAAGEPPETAIRVLAALPVLETSADYRLEPGRLAALIEVQRALLNLCAGRADAVAVLSLPEHFDRRDVLEWRRELATSGYDTALSYAVVYYPWVQLRETATPELALLRHLPPDGAACGVIAARELARGPWVAPANLTLQGVVGLAPAVGEADWVELFDAQVNLLYQQPGRFTQMSAHTLSPDPTLVQLSVRRLLIFLRKLCLRRGMEYVFEANNERFRRRVEAGLDRTLNRLLARGALVAYQVVTGEGLNTLNDVENGRFIVAIKVAPTQPIEFITVALLRSGEGLLEVVEA